jgi:hypothetical protein
MRREEAIAGCLILGMYLGAKGQEMMKKAKYMKVNLQFMLEL